MTTKETIAALESGELSILGSLDATGLLAEMSSTIALSNTLMSLVFTPQFQATAEKDPSLYVKRRTHIIGFLRLVFMPLISGKKHLSSISADTAVAFVFNHCCLDEPFIAAWCLFDKFPDRELAIPIKLPWYEGIRHWVPVLRKVGVYLCPMITPKMEEQICSSKLDEMRTYQSILMAKYRQTIADLTARHQSLGIAQPATRQRYLAASKHQLETGEGLIPTAGMIKVGARSAKTVAIPIMSELPRFALPERVHAQYKSLPTFVRLLTWLLLPLRLLYAWWPKFGKVNILCWHHWRIGRPLLLSECKVKEVDHLVVTEMARICHQKSYLYPRAAD